MRRSLRDIGGRARRWMHRQRATRAEVADGPASPADGGWGGPLLHTGLLTGSDTMRDSASTAAIEATRSLTLSGDANTAWNHITVTEQALRAANRHGWFPVLAHRHALGDETAGQEAISAMSSWLATDVPGRGPGWAHTTDLVARLIHWSIGVGWLQNTADADFRKRLAGSAQQHLAHLETRLDPLTDGDLRRPLQLCGLIVGGLSWPGLANADGQWSDALAALPSAVEAQLYADGVDRLRAPDRLLDLLVHLFATRAVCVHNQVGFPRSLDGAIARATTYLCALSDTNGTLPPLGAAYPFRLLDLDGAADRVKGISQVAQSLGLIAPEEDDVPENLFAMIFGEQLKNNDGNALAQPTTEKTTNIQKRAPLKSEWSLRAFRDGRIFIGRAEVKKQLSRLIVDAGIAPQIGPHAPTPMHILWWIGDTQVLADPGELLNDPGVNQTLESCGAHNTLQVNGQAPIAGDPDPQIQHARVDGRVMRITAERESRDGLWSHRRDVNARQARLTIIDKIEADGSVAVELNWQLGPGWEWERNDKGLQATKDGLKLLVKLDERLDWSVREGQHDPEAGWVSTNGTLLAAPAIFGQGMIDSGEPIKTIFEIR